MNIHTVFYLSLFTCVGLVVMGCATKNSPRCCDVETKTITIYENEPIPANTGISTGIYTEVDGYRYVNVFVEFEQNSADEEPVSLGVSFAHSSNGNLSARRYFTFEENFTGQADPQFIDITGEASWHGHPHDVSRYMARLPVMGPYIQVFPFNHHSQPRAISIVLYLTE